MRANVPFSLLALFALGAGLGVAVGTRVGGPSSLALAAPTIATGTAGARTQEEQTVISVARSVTPVVVSITVPNYGSGSGAIIRRDGMDGQRVRGAGDLGRILRGHKPGDTATFTVVRPPNGTRATISVKLGQAPT